MGRNTLREAGYESCVCLKNMFDVEGEIEFLGVGSTHNPDLSVSSKAMYCMGSTTKISRFGFLNIDTRIYNNMVYMVVIIVIIHIVRDNILSFK